MFYTKYRPQLFSEIAKPNETAEALLNQLKTGKTAHAYLFVGSRGTGKTTTARILAKALNCQKLDKSGDPCNECDNCLAITKGSFIDLIEIDAASNRGIDDIRELKDRVKLAPAHGKIKTYIIDEVHMLTTEAFNALLKTLEEPPKHVVFILCTTELHKVPETVRSRCQVFKFKRATVSQLTIKLKKIADAEGAKIDKDTLAVIAKASFGGYRDAETLLQQVVEGSIDIKSLLNANIRSSYTEFTARLQEKDAAACIRTVNKLFEDGVDLFTWTGELIKHFRDILFIKSGVAKDLVELTEEDLDEVQKLSAKISNGEVVLYLERFVEAQNNIKSSQLPTLPIELAVFDLCTCGGRGSKQFTDASGEDSPNAADSMGSGASVGSDAALIITPKVAVAPVSVSPVIPNPTSVEPKETQTKEPVKTAQASATASATVTANTATTASTATTPTTTVPSPAKNRATLADTKPIKGKVIPIEDIKAKWDEVIKAVARINNSIQTLLKQGKVIGIEEDGIQLEVSYLFHKERLESPKNRQMIEEALSAVFGIPQTIKCFVNADMRAPKGDPRVSGELTDYNIAPVTSATAPVSGNILDIFDGGLPLGSK